MTFGELLDSECAMRKESVALWRFLFRSTNGVGEVWSDFPEPDLIGIGAAVTRRPLPHHRAYGSVHGGSSWLR
jgi:hypothetical protein